MQRHRRRPPAIGAAARRSRSAAARSRGCTIHVTDVRFKAVTEEWIETGLVGFISLTVNDVFVLDGITLRRSQL